MKQAIVNQKKASNTAKIINCIKEAVPQRLSGY